MFSRKIAPGIEMRLFELKDAETVFAVVESNRAYLREWLPWVDFTASAENIRGFILRVRQQFESSGGPQAGIWIDGEFGGSLGCHPIDWPNKNCGIGYWIAERYRGKGIVTRCCAAMVDYLLRDLRLHRVTIQCGTGNGRSCAIPERLGFTREGVTREGEWVNDRWIDLVVWGMLEQEWKGKPAAGRGKSKRIV